MPPTAIQNKKIHLARHQIGMTDEVYRDILWLDFKVGSSKALNPFQAERLLDIFRAKGWQAKPSKKKGTSPEYGERYQRKIVAMWITLADAGVIRNRSDAALQAYVKRLTRIGNLKWCLEADCYPVIESLKAMGKRNDVDFD